MRWHQNKHRINKFGHLTYQNQTDKI